MQIIEHKVLLVDGSGSMCIYQKETQTAIFNIIKELNKDTHLTLIFFDTSKYHVVADDRVSNIQPELAYLFKGIGGTPITDSVYKAIDDITTSVKDIELLAQKHKFIIFTDGEENSSRFVDANKLGNAIEHFTNMFGWDFQFIGPKNCESSIRNYTNSIKISKENVTLYANMSEGLKEMKKQMVNI